MKKLWIVFSIAIIIVVFVVAGSILLFNSKTDNYDSSKEIDLGINNMISTFEKCVNNSSVLYDGTMDCKDFNSEDFGKLNLLKDINGVFACGPNGTNFDGEAWARCNAIIKECERIFSVGYYNRGMPDSGISSFSIYDCNGKQYYARSSTAPPDLWLAEIKLNTDVIDKLKK